jgi:hypothetical protein
MYNFGSTLSTVLFYDAGEEETKKSEVKSTERMYDNDIQACIPYVFLRRRL